MATLAFDSRGLTVLILYLGMCLLIGGAGFVRRVRSREEETMQDHFLAGKSGLPTAVLLGTLLATAAVPCLHGVFITCTRGWP